MNSRKIGARGVCRDGRIKTCVSLFARRIEAVLDPLPPCAIIHREFQVLVDPWTCAFAVPDGTTVFVVNDRELLRFLKRLNRESGEERAGAVGPQVHSRPR